eukprot:TRINITY_DN2224_c0_g1_i2.p1 TRINITY_DN2224_c0_g1~~TRINITY_DN2224_c0_g1_i2.p1  ORF type:complete len:900 (+),score=243.07 TRINITY_DN2224_c0_g1_i2:39-2738(+)
MVPSPIRLCAESAESALELLESSADGLSHEEAQRRLEIYGPNELLEKPQPHIVLRFLEQFSDPLILMLVGSAVVSLLLGEVEDAAGIIIALLIVSTVGFVQEYKSEQIVDALKKLTSHTAHVLRSRVVVEVDSSSLVPGDVVVLVPGAFVPADLRVLSSQDLAANESALTGETVPVAKDRGSVSESSAEQLQQRSCMLFMGTTIAAGKGHALVIATGGLTELGKISQMVQDAEAPRTPLQRQMDHLGKQLSVVSTAIVVVICLIGWLQGRSLLHMFTIGVSLAVAAIPEGLPIVVTVTLAVGVGRMAKKNAIVRKLPAVETLGACTVICCDKTGTLTRNEMTVRRVFTTDTINVTGIGYSTEGHFEENGTPVNTPHLQKLLEVGMLCNDAQFGPEGLMGQPTEGAILVAALKGGISDSRNRRQRVKEILFTSETKWMAVAYEGSDKTLEYSVKGAPDTLLDKCVLLQHGEKRIHFSDRHREGVMAVVREYARHGERVVAFAYGSDLESDLTFVGLMAIEDPPRDGVADAVQRVQRSGVRVVMITGDNNDTALSIARHLHIYADGDSSMSGKELSTHTVTSLSEVVNSVSVFYRVTPAHKMLIVQALKHNGNVVAMTGDGINDAPALSAADIGIAMGRGGTDVAKEASQMILVDDNFVTIVSAIEEGKSIFDNTGNFLRFQLTTSVAALSIIALSTFLRFEMPFNAIQILWINIIMDGPPAQSLGMEPMRSDVMKEPPRNPNTPVVTPSMLKNVLSTAALMVLATLGVFFYEDSIYQHTEDDDENEKAMTMAFTTFVWLQMFNAANCRSRTLSVLSLGVWSNPVFVYAIAGSVAGQLCVVYFPFFNYVFDTVPLSFAELLLTVFVASSVLVMDETRKSVFAVGHQSSRRALSRSGDDHRV